MKVIEELKAWLDKEIKEHEFYAVELGEQYDKGVRGAHELTLRKIEELEGGK